MWPQFLTRRAFFLSVGAGAAAAGLGGCHPAAPIGQVARVVISVGWKYLSKLLKAVLTDNGEVILTALVGEATEEIKAQLTSEQHRDLAKGGKLILRTEDGKEHEITFTRQDSPGSAPAKPKGTGGRT